MSDKKPSKPKVKRKKVTTEDLQGKLEQIQGRVRSDLTSNQALIAIGVIAVSGMLFAASYWLGRRSR